MKRKRNYFFPLLLLLSILVVSTVGYLGKSTIYKNYTYSIKSTPYLAMVMKGVYDGVYPTDLLFSKADSETETTESTVEEDDDVSAVDTSDDNSSADATTQTAQTQTVEEDDPSVTYDFEIVDDSYFDDALFIGDSRTVGFSQYSGLYNATYYADTGISIYTILTKAFITVDGSDTLMTIDEALQKNTYSKIYIMLGINELGTGTPESFLEKYQEVVNRIQELQPRALIFVQSIMHVNAELNSTDEVFNNTNINERNSYLATLANNHNIFYLDVNQVVTDENGNLYEDYSFDGIHLKAEYIGVWKDFLINNGIITDSLVKVCYYWEAPGYTGE